MAVIKRNKSTVYGLNTDLANIQSTMGANAALQYVSASGSNHIDTATSLKNADELLDAALGTLESNIGTVSGLTTTAQTIVGGINELDAEIGSNTLTTSASTLSGAINELDSNIGDMNLLPGRASSVIGAVSDMDTAKMDKSANLSDVSNVATARTNLGVYSTSETDAAITAAQLAMGSNFDVADIPGRNALTGLDTTDRVFVADDGDTKWALYKPTAVDANGTGTAWVKIMDQNVLETAISATTIKASYESNTNTNAYTDADLAKVGYLSVTSAIDLDKVIQNDELITDTGLAGVTDTNIASGLAIKTYVNNQNALDLKIASNLSDLANVATARTNLDVYSKAEADALIGAGGAGFTTESVIVANDSITLTKDPKNGVIFNFATCRYTDTNNVTYDIPLTSTANTKVFNLSPDTAGQFDTKTVVVQYAYAT